MFLDFTKVEKIFLVTVRPIFAKELTDSPGLSNKTMS